MNYKNKGLTLAKQQFLEDLKQDIDFIGYRERTKPEDGYTYGTLIAGRNCYILNMIGTSSENIIINFLKHLK